MTVAGVVVRRRRLVLGSVLALALVVALVAADAVILVRRMPTVEVSPPGSDSGTTYLLVASDSRDRLPAAERRRYADVHQPRGERADLVLLLRAPPTGPARLYSVPRDLYVGEQRDDPHRLGLALAGGVQELVDSLCTDVGIGVDHVVVADFAALIDLVDVVGGVPVTVAAPIRDRQAALALPAGPQQLDGPQALAWVRSRHPEVRHGAAWVPDSTADPTRSTHAMQVLSGVSGTLDDPITVQRAVWAVGPRLRRDAGLDLPQLAELARDLREATAGGLVTVPTRFTGTLVPFAFMTEETTATLRPLRSAACPLP